MHEMSIAQNILEIVESALSENPGSRLKKVVVKAGELVAVVPESLQFCYQAITAGTPLEGSEPLRELRQGVPDRIFLFPVSPMRECAGKSAQRPGAAGERAGSGVSFKSARGSSASCQNNSQRPPGSTTRAFR